MFRKTRSRDARAVRLALRGDTDAFTALVDHYMPIAHAVACAQLGSPEDAEDVVQESFLKAYRRLDTLREAAKFGSWFVAIVRNACRDVLAKRGRRAHLDAAAPPPDTVALPEHEHAELRANLLQHIEQLTPVYREPLLLHYFAGRPVAEIAALLELSPAAVKKRLQRARESLSERMLSAIEPALQPSQDTKRQRTQILSAVAAAPTPWLAKAGGAGMAGAGAAGLTGKAAVLFTLVAVVLAGWFAYEMQKPEPETDSASTAVVEPAQDTLLPDIGVQATPASQGDTQGSVDGLNEGPGVVTGTVFKKGSEERLAGVAVTVRKMHTGSEHVVVSDEQGCFRVEGLSTVHAYEFEPSGSEYWLPGRKTVQLHEVEPPESTVELFIEKTASVAGRVYDKDTGEGIAGVKVSAEQPGSEYDIGTTTDEEGRYQIDGLHSASNRVYCEAPRGMVSARRELGGACGGGRIPSVSLGGLNPDVVAKADFPLEDGICIAGRVVDGDGNPLERASIQFNFRRENGEHGKGIRSGKDGRFSLTMAHNDAVRSRLFISGRSHPATEEAGGAGPGQIMQVIPEQGPYDLSDPSLEELELVASPSALITGTIVNRKGHPVSGALPYVGTLRGTKQSAFSPWGPVTGVDGAFQITGIPEGTYRLAAAMMSDDYDSVETAAYQEVTVKYGQTLSGFALSTRAMPVSPCPEGLQIVKVNLSRERASSSSPTRAAYTS